MYEPPSLPALLAGLLPTTREWMRERGLIEYVIEDGQLSPRLTTKGQEWIEEHAARFKRPEI